MSQSSSESARDAEPTSPLSATASRRAVLGGMAGSILATAGMVAVGKPVFAQDATPEAEVLPAFPPEIEEFAND